MFATIKRRVELFLVEDAAYTPEESAVIVELDRLVRSKRYRDAADVVEARGSSDPILANQKVQSLVGQAYAKLGPDFRTKARECFKAADELNYSDIFMARAWFHVENDSEYGNKNAISVCERFLSQPKLSTRDKAEFKSKIASCYHEQATRLRGVSSEKAIDFYILSIESYLSSLWIGRFVDQLDQEKTLRWLSIPAFQFVDYLQNDLEPFFKMLERLPQQKHDVHLDGARVLVQALRRSTADRDEQAKAKIAGLMRRTIRTLEKFVGDGAYPGFEFLIDTLTLVQLRLAGRLK